ncbi:MAG: HDOD domain-containing protein [Candidatus Scalinduaceae bacterium]
MRKILFVDDNPKEIKGLKKILQPMLQEWEVEFALSGKEALSFMNESIFDVIVSDTHMPEMNGVELLGIVMERHPATVRIILSEHSDKEMVLKSVETAHQFLMKPCNVEIIRYTIERACKLRDLLGNETLKRIVGGIKDLPSLPKLYNLIINEMKSPDASLKRVGEIIAQDISMSAKILQLVNSAFFGLPRKITDPQQAAVYLGSETLKALVLSINLFSSFPEDSELFWFSLADMRKRSLMVGRLARDIANIESEDKSTVEVALIAGILHDIGRLIMLKIPDQCRMMMDFIERTGCGLLEAEYTVMKTSHAELGGYLLGLWGIDNSIVEAVAFHHNPSRLLEGTVVQLKKPSGEDVGNKLSQELSALTAVHIANSLMMQEDSSSDTTIYPYVDIRYLKALNLENKLPEWMDCCNKIKQEDV